MITGVLKHIIRKLEENFFSDVQKYMFSYSYYSQRKCIILMSLERLVILLLLYLNNIILNSYIHRFK